MDSDPEFVKIEKNCEKDSDKDSGMSSLTESKDDTPEQDDGKYDNEPDESLMERILGLSEMFPGPVVDFFSSFGEKAVDGVKSCYSFGCNAAWIFFTSSLILFAPIVFETERAQMEEMQKCQQKQVLLGPGTAAGAAPMPSTR